jgi:hypothetical protein
MQVSLTRGLVMQCDEDVYLRFYLTTGGASLCAHKGGYAKFFYKGKFHLFHRWVMDCTDPNLVVQHIDANPSNNYLYNLEIVTPAQNKRNLNDTIVSSNTSGVRGVYWNNYHQKWLAQITNGNNSLFLGYFENFDDAVVARKQAEIKYGFTPKV